MRGPKHTSSEDDRVRGRALGQLLEVRALSLATVAAADEEELVDLAGLDEVHNGACGERERQWTRRTPATVRNSRTSSHNQPNANCRSCAPYMPSKKDEVQARTMKATCTSRAQRRSCCGAMHTGHGEDSVVAEADVDKLLGLGLGEAFLRERRLDDSGEVAVLDVGHALPAHSVHGPDAVPVNDTEPRRTC